MEKNMQTGNVIDIMNSLSPRGKVSLVVALEDTDEDFDRRLSEAMTTLFLEKPIKVKSLNVPNSLGEHIVLYDIDFDRRRPLPSL